jgi:hypothetical protein
MKVSGKGVIVILLFLIVIPAIADLAMSVLLPKGYNRKFAMLQLLANGYLRNLPFYIGYLIVAFTIIFLIKKWKQRHAKN